MYSVVNEALNRVFLSGRFESRPLYLVLDKFGRAELADLLQEEPEDVEEFCCRVVGGRLDRAGDPYKQLNLARFKWRAAGRKTEPPFTALLFTLAHAAELMVSDGQFSSGNYYHRLAGLTGLEPQRLSMHGRSTEFFWKAFNQWLADTDFQYGRPTARAVNSLRYVGIAMSQAIVREADRQRFHDLFEKYGFTGTDLVTEEEIGQYIENWIHGSKPTRQLKAAWAKAELRPRICEAAVAELEDWGREGAARRTGNGVNGTRLSLAASFRHDVFSRSVTLWFGREAAIDNVELSGGGFGEKSLLGNSTFGGFATVEPRSSINLANALTRGFELDSAEGSTFGWAARAVVPLSRSERGSYWTEANRATMGVEHLVLARSEKKVRESVESALEEIAAPGYTVSTPEVLKGLPAGWLLYEGVRIVRPLENVDGFQAALSPVGTTSGLQVGGGLKIGRSIWHEERPPTILLDTREPSSKIKAWEGVSPEGSPILEVPCDLGQAILDLSTCLPESGNIFVEGAVGEKVVGTASLLMRSACRPRPLDRQGRGQLAHNNATHCGPLESGGAQVRGYLAPSGVRLPANLDLLNRFRELGGSSEGQEDPPHDRDDKAATRSAGISLVGMPVEEVIKLPCAVRGFHRYVYEMLPPSFPKYAPVNKECKDCGVALLHHRRQGASPAKARSQPPRPIPTTSATAPVSTRDFPCDLWLDAACFWGAGSVASFEALVSAEGLDPWRAAEVLKCFNWLGHLDVAVGGNWRPRGWSVSPPTLSFVDDRAAILAGFRSNDFISEIADLARTAGASFELQKKAGQPALAKVTGLTPEEAGAAFDVAVDAHGRQLAITDAKSSLATFCSSGPPVFCSMARVSLSPLGAVEKFDVARGRWRSVESSSEPGAYRFSYAGTHYAYRAASGRAFGGPYELVKLAAARLVGSRIHAYSPEERAFTSVLGCEPPGLLSRTLVACSGELPKIQQGVSRFGRVPPEVAATILDILYSGDLPS